MPMFFLSAVIVPCTAYAVALALLIEPAANFVGGLIMSSITRQAVLTVGVAANDASWLVPVTTLAARAVGILRIAGLINSYEVPLLPDTPIPSAVQPATEGALGSYDNPLPYDSSRLKYTVSTFIAIPAAVSTDGIDHVWPTGVYTPVQMLEKCAQFMLVWKGAVNSAPCAITTDPNVVSWLAGRRGQVSTSVQYQYLYTQAFFVEGIDFGVPSGRVTISVAEEADGVKRFVRSTDGFSPDSSDVDWTAAEKAAFAVPSPIKFTSADSVVQVSSSSAGTQIQAATQSGANVKIREVVLSPTATASSVAERVLQNTTVADAVASSTNTNTGAIVFPTDYARQGEVASGVSTLSAKLTELLDTTPLQNQDSGALTKLEAADALMGERDKKIKDLPTADQPEITSWLPSLLPGQRVACRSLVYEQRITHGPSAGLSGDFEFATCDHLEILQEIAAWLFSIATIIYVWRLFSRGNGSGVPA